jgi:hypothetical protein
MELGRKKELYCSPDREKNGSFTCYSKSDLILLAKSYNKNRPKDKHIIIGNSKKKLWSQLQNRLSNECETEWCWLEKKFVPAPYSQKILKENFKPEKPKEWNKNPFEWLSTLDIKKVMKQYEKKYKKFLFIGPVPVDCPSEITCALSGLNIEILIKRLGKTKLGIVFNLDPHDKPGSHWVAVYSDFVKARIFYFDSVGLPPPRPIRLFLEKLKKQIDNFHLNYFKKQKNTPILINRTKFQYGSSECGIFSMYFIISNLRNIGVEKFDKNNVNDKKMNHLRNVLYRPS